MMWFVREGWGLDKSSGRRLRPLRGFSEQGFLTDGGRWPWERRKGETRFDREVSSEKAGKMVGLLMVLSTQEERLNVGRRP